MKPKIKLIYAAPAFAFKAMRSRKIAKKIIKYKDEDRYPAIWKNNYVLKKGKKFLKFLNVELEVIGFDNIPKSTSLMIANHSSSVDATALLVALENPGHSLEDVNYMPVFLGKQDLKKNKRFVGYMDILNTFYINRKNPRQSLEALNEIQEHAKEFKKHIVVFPEGTRSKDGKIKEFKSGGFRIAKKSFIPIVPVTINNILSATDLNRSTKLKVQVIFHKQIKPLSFMTMDHNSLATKVKKIIESKWKKPEGSRSSKEGKMV